MTIITRRISIYLLATIIFLNKVSIVLQESMKYSNMVSKDVDLGGADDDTAARPIF